MCAVGSNGRTSIHHHGKLQLEEDLGLVHRIRHIMRRIYIDSGWIDSAAAGAIRTFLNSKFFGVLIAVSLLIALFLSDVGVVAQVPTNTELDVVLTMVFIVFLAEFVGLSLTDTSYFLGFFFWMDLVGTLSMVYDFSYALGEDATQNHKATASSQDNTIVVRAARAAKLGARAGRLTRVMKVLRFLTKGNEDEEKDQMAKVISNQLTNALSTRVAFLTIAIVVLMPLFGLFNYPESDDSMLAWSELLDANANAYREASASGNAVLSSELLARLKRETQRLGNFYDSNGASYGPFKVCLGAMEVLDNFVCSEVIDFSTKFSEPNRKASIVTFSQSALEVSFDLSQPKIEGGASSLGLLVFIIMVMCGFGMVMSHSISAIALRPLERMLAVVRERCTQILSIPMT